MNHEKTTFSCSLKENLELCKLSDEALNAEIDYILSQDANTMDVSRLKQCLDLLQERSPVSIGISPDDAWGAFVGQYPILTDLENQTHKEQHIQSV